MSLLQATSPEVSLSRNSAFNLSRLWLLKVKAELLSHVRLFATPWTVARQARLSMGFSKQEHWSGFSCPLPTEEYLLPNNVAYFPPGKELLQRDLKKIRIFRGKNASLGEP